MNSLFTHQDILSNLEEPDQETYHFFIDFEHPYFYTAGSRLTLFADENRWAIVFEKSGYSTGNNCGEIELTYFGNCLRNLQSGIDGDTTTSNMKSVILINDTDMAEIGAGEFMGLVAKEKNQIKVRGTMLNIEQYSSKYIDKGISPRNYDNPKNLLDFYSLIRYLDEENPVIFKATDKELRMCLPEDLPHLMQIDKWHHKAYKKYKKMTSPTEYEYAVMGKKPSEYETYKMIADVLVTRDVTRWTPTLTPNNNWRNWPNAGHM